MLVLTRKVGERINIGDDIVLTVVDINKGSIRLGIDAPRHVSVYRHEVFQKIQEENLESSKGVSNDVADAARILREKRIKN